MWASSIPRALWHKPGTLVGVYMSDLGEGGVQSVFRASGEGEMPEVCVGGLSSSFPSLLLQAPFPFYPFSAVLLGQEASPGLYGMSLALERERERGRMPSHSLQFLLMK